jgi:hypothetical protein
MLLTRQPFSAVQSSKATQAPTALGGSVYKNVESLWQGTTHHDMSVYLVGTDDSPIPPIFGCLHMIILCKTRGFACSPKSLANFAILGSSSVYFRKIELRGARAWPILFIERDGGTFSREGASGVASVRADGSRKYLICWISSFMD